MTGPILTISIPTFNGSKTIAQALNSVFMQIHPSIESDVEIIISDNASTDDTKAVVDSLGSSKTEVIKYFKNSSNLGFDRNIALLFERASGKYVLTLADDDCLEKGALVEIISFLRCNPNLDVYFIGGTALTVKEKNLICKDGNEFFLNTAFRNGGVSSNIFKRETWNSISVEKYFDSGWIHFAVLIKILENGSSGISRSSYVKEIPQLEKKWGKNGQFIIVGLKLAAILKNMNSSAYTRAVRRKSLDTIHDSNYFKKIIRAKSEGLFVDISVLKIFILLFKSYPTFWILDLPALFLPVNACRYIMRVRDWMLANHFISH